MALNKIRANANNYNKDQEGEQISGVVLHGLSFNQLRYVVVYMMAVMGRSRTYASAC